MKISLDWLKDYVSLPGSADELSSRLTEGGTEVVGRVRSGDVPARIVVAQILSREQHPNADRLSVCQVEDGSGQPRQIVCGAKNFQVGDKVPLALPGAVLGPDCKIKSGKLRGVVSDGMMCSAKELGLAEDAEGLLILPADATVGRELRELFQPDEIFELEVTPNRPDLLGYWGVAREVAALTGAADCRPDVSHPEEKSAGEVVCLADPSCPFYTARIIRGVKVAPSPEWLQRRLESVGLRPINNIVDITNFVLHETGQPLHAFDLAKLGKRIVVRSAIDGEQIVALDGATVQLRERDLVIADTDKPVAIAGIMGGAATGVSETTTDILLESAWFEPSRIRRSSRELVIGTDSSYRFERRVDPLGVKAASARATDLILNLAGGAADPNLLVAGEIPESGANVSFDPARCRALLGLQVSDEEINQVLRRLGLERSGGSWQVPSYRPDLSREVDLIEEVVRMVGIERVPSRLRGFPAPVGPADVRYNNAAKLRERLRAQGFSEARTSHFVSADSLRASGQSSDDAVTISNPLGTEQALLRSSLMSGLLEATARNLRHGVPDVRLFELGRVFSCGAKQEASALALVTTGLRDAADWQEDSLESDLSDLKGVIESVLGKLESEERGEPGLVLRLRGAGFEGVLQRLSRAQAERIGAKSPVFFAELSVDDWLGAREASVRVSPLPKFPAVERDLSLVLPGAASYARLSASIRGSRVPHLEKWELKDVFADPTGVKLPADLRSLTVTLTFREVARTLTADEVDRSVQSLCDHVKSELGAVLRS